MGRCPSASGWSRKSKGVVTAGQAGWLLARDCCCPGWAARKPVVSAIPSCERQYEIRGKVDICIRYLSTGTGVFF